MQNVRVHHCNNSLEQQTRLREKVRRHGSVLIVPLTSYVIYPHDVMRHKQNCELVRVTSPILSPSPIKSN